MPDITTRKYNGWTNYATWRVHLELLGDIVFEDPVTVDELKEIVEECIFSNYEIYSGSHLVEDYARSFISNVNYDEIAKYINEEINIQTKYDD
jgi:hypothetical protein